MAYTAGMALMRAGWNDEQTFTSMRSVSLGEDEFSVVEDASYIPPIPHPEFDPVLERQDIQNGQSMLQDMLETPQTLEDLQSMFGTASHESQFLLVGLTMRRHFTAQTRYPATAASSCPRGEYSQAARRLEATQSEHSVVNVGLGVDVLVVSEIPDGVFFSYVDVPSPCGYS